MSANLFCDEHFHAIATWAISGRRQSLPVFHGDTRHDMTDPAEIARVLRDENVRSVRHCYGDTVNVGPYAYRPFGRGDFSAADILCACAGLRYQSCECPDHETTLAAAILRAIEKAAVRVVTEDSDCWSISGQTLAARRERLAAAR